MKQAKFIDHKVTDEGLYIRGITGPGFTPDVEIFVPREDAEEFGWLDAEDKSDECADLSSAGSVNLSDYQQEVVRTRATSDHNETIKMALIGLFGETGEVSDMLKKYLFQGHSLAGAKLLDEMGDIMWYLATLANEFNISLEDVLQHNIEKLRKRYPDGFSSERSINREESHG